MGLQKDVRVAVCFDRNCPLDHHCLYRSWFHHFSLRDGSRDGGIPTVSAGLGPQEEQQLAFISHGSAKEYCHQSGASSPSQQLYACAPSGKLGHSFAEMGWGDPKTEVESFGEDSGVGGQSIRTLCMQGKCPTT